MTDPELALTLVTCLCTMLFAGWVTYDISLGSMNCAYLSGMFSGVLTYAQGYSMYTTSFWGDGPIFLVLAISVLALIILGFPLVIGIIGKYHASDQKYAYLRYVC